MFTKWVTYHGNLGVPAGIPPPMIPVRKLKLPRSNRGPEFIRGGMGQVSTRSRLGPLSAAQVPFQLSRGALRLRRATQGWVGRLTTRQPHGPTGIAVCGSTGRRSGPGWAGAPGPDFSSFVSESEHVSSWYSRASHGTTNRQTTAKNKALCSLYFLFFLTCSSCPSLQGAIPGRK